MNNMMNALNSVLYGKNKIVSEDGSLLIKKDGFHNVFPDNLTEIFRSLHSSYCTNTPDVYGLKVNVILNDDDPVPKYVSVRPGVKTTLFRNFMTDYYRRKRVKNSFSQEEDIDSRERQDQIFPRSISDNPEDLYPIDFLQLGEFKPSYARDPNNLGKIIIYTKAISQCSETQKTNYDVVFWATLANQAFRAFLYSRLKAQGDQTRWSSAGSRRYSDIVQNSLAAFFEYKYLTEFDIWEDIYRNNELSDLLIEEWQRFDIDTWPSSGALWIKEKGFFSDLLKISQIDWKAPADILKAGYCCLDPRINNYLP